jgi:nucleoside-diphosphate-sugar epimerase
MGNLLEDDLNHVMNHTQGLWQALEGERVFITGGTGFLGCWLLESFVWAVDVLKINASALVLTRNLTAFQKKAPHLANHPALSFISGDVRSFDFPAGKFSHIIHAATDVKVQSVVEHPLEMFDTIVEGTRHILDFARVCGVEKILLVSSGAVYGKQPSEMEQILESYLGAPETSHPTSAYGEGKRAAELLCHIYGDSYGFDIKIARCFAFVGPYMPLNGQFAIGNFIRDCLNGGPVHVKGTGNVYRSYLYASDLAIWLWTILFNSDRGAVYNVGSDQEMTIAQVAHLVAHLPISTPCEVCIHNQEQASLGIDRYLPNVQKARRELNLDVWVDSHQSCAKSYSWYLKY